MLRACLIIIYLLVGAACTQGTPDLQVLNEDAIPRPKFAGSTIKNMTTSSSSVTFDIQGECDPKIRSILGAATGTNATFDSLSSLAVSGVTVTCATDGKFSFTLKSLSDLGFSVTEGETYEVQLRAETSGGLSKPSYIRILYGASSNGRRPILITSGTNTITDGANNLKAEVRIGNRQNATAAISGDDTSTKTGGGLSATIGVKINY
jgi:hypothetical protein